MTLIVYSSDKELFNGGFGFGIGALYVLSSALLPLKLDYDLKQILARFLKDTMEKYCCWTHWIRPLNRGDREEHFEPLFKQIG